MDRLSWIMSGGGPLIGLEARFAASWGGVSRLTVLKAGAANDYERPSEKLGFLSSVPLQVGWALVFGEGPLDTAFWRSSNGTLFVVRTEYCDPDVDIRAIMSALDEKIFENPREVLEFTFELPDVILFDSAEEGTIPTRRLSPHRSSRDDIGSSRNPMSLTRGPRWCCTSSSGSTKRAERHMNSRPSCRKIASITAKTCGASGVPITSSRRRPLSAISPPMRLEWSASMTMTDQGWSSGLR